MPALLVPARRRTSIAQPYETEHSLNTHAAGGVAPGDVLSEATSHFAAANAAAHGRAIYAHACGYIATDGKQVAVRAIREPYSGGMGDIVVGRVVKVEMGRWHVDVGSQKPAHLLSGGYHWGQNSAQTIRKQTSGAEMRAALREGDAIVAEVQRGEGDAGSNIVLQCRTTLYGLLQSGVLVEGPRGNVQRHPKHQISLKPNRTGSEPLAVLAKNDGLVRMVIGKNGWCWIGVQPTTDIAAKRESSMWHSAARTQDAESIPDQTRAFINALVEKAREAADNGEALTQYLFTGS